MSQYNNYIDFLQLAMNKANEQSQRKLGRTMSNLQPAMSFFLSRRTRNINESHIASTMAKIEEKYQSEYQLIVNRCEDIDKLIDKVATEIFIRVTLAIAMFGLLK